MLDDIAEETGRSQGAQDALLAEILRRMEMIEHGGEDAAAAAGGGGDNLAAGGILLADGEGVGVDQAAALERLGIAGGVDIVADGLTAHAEAAGENAFGLDAALDGGFHHLPHAVEVVPDLGAFALVDILPVALAGGGAPLEDVFDRVHGVDLLLGDAAVFAVEDDVSAADAVPGVLEQQALVGVEGAEGHAVGMEGQECVRLPDDTGGGDGLEDVEDGAVGEVAAAGCGERAVEHHFEGGGVAFAELHEGLRGLHRAHGVGAGGAVAYLEQLS